MHSCVGDRFRPVIYVGGSRSSQDGVTMLRLKKIRIIGFKSFCDRTELSVPGTGVAVVVGPNGCGKSNILDAVSWVLGEQSAKSLRGAGMLCGLPAFPGKGNPVHGGHALQAHDAGRGSDLWRDDAGSWSLKDRERSDRTPRRKARRPVRIRVWASEIWGKTRFEHILTVHF